MAKQHLIQVLLLKALVEYLSMLVVKEMLSSSGALEWMLKCRKKVVKIEKKAR